MNNLDDQLIRLLQADGRASFSDLSKQLGVARATVTARVNDMLSSGELRIVAAVHPRLLGLSAVAHVSIQLSGPAQPVLQTLERLEGAVFASLTTGAYGVTAELRLPDMARLHQHIEAIRHSEGVSAVDILMYKNVVRSLFLGQEPPDAGLELDHTDLLIMDQLQRDGRLGFEALGERVGLSASAARVRVLRLLDARIMQVGPILSRSGSSQSMAFGLGVSVSTDTAEAIDLLAATPGVEFVANCLGRYDLVGTIGVGSTAEAHGILEQLRALDSVSGADSWLHLKIVQERYDKPLDKILASLDT